jgi:hypothetical protein
MSCQTKTPAGRIEATSPNGARKVACGKHPRDLKLIFFVNLLLPPAA